MTMDDAVSRAAEIERSTAETTISLRLALDGAGEGARSTGVGFFDHMLDLLNSAAASWRVPRSSGSALSVLAKDWTRCSEPGAASLLPAGAIGDFDYELAEEFFRAVAANGRLTLHLTIEAGTNAHHMIEAIFKACARALRTAVALDPSEPGIPSTKGTL